MNISFLLGIFCFILNLGLGSGKKPEFLDLSLIDYEFISQGYPDFIIQIRPLSLKVSCVGCNFSKDNKIKCKNRELVAVKIEMKNDKMKISIPFNITCTYWSLSLVYYQIQNITFKIGINNISLSWAYPYIRIIYYKIYFFNGANQINEHIQNAQNNSIFISNLKEKTWYQFCIAVTDVGWGTGIFVCKQVLTDFSATGPVTNFSAKSESDKIFISWSLPQYEHDIPQGYVVHLKGPHNFCKIVIIKMVEVDIPNDEKCLNNFTTSWSSLKTLEITGLDPYSEFQIEIIPFNRNKKPEKTSLSIKTKEGESDAVEDLKLNTSSPGYLIIAFKESKRPRGKILKYRIKITSTKIGICRKRDAFKYEIYVNRQVEPVNLGVLKNCGLYLIEVTPVNGWDQNGGLGKPASIPYELSFVNTGTMTSNASFLSSNMAEVIISRWKEQCSINGIVVSMINENNKKDCLTRIMANDNCEELKNDVQRSHNCPNIEFVQFDHQSSDIRIFFSVAYQKKNKYKIGVSRILERIENITFSDISVTGEMSGCFTDCFNPGQIYSGIRSATENGEVCQDWNNTNYKSKRSNICSVTDNPEPWCHVRNTRERCSVPKCAEIDYGTGCVKYHQMPEESNAARIIWSPPDQGVPVIGYLTLLHNSNHFCEQYQLQLKENSTSETQLDNSIKSFYLSCKSGQQTPSTRNAAHFKGLHQNRTFLVYIIPIILESKSGELRNLTFQTSLAKPGVPKLSIKSESLGKMFLSLEQQNETKEYGAASHYLLKIRKGTIEQEMVIQKEGVILEQLEMCSKYCFRLSSVNEAGSSGFSKEICSQTLVPKPGIVILDDLESGFMKNQEVSWSYSGPDECLRRYRVEYWEKYKEKSKDILANESSAELKNLKTNAIYVVRVRAEGLMETLNNDSTGEYSPEKQFYTGDTELELSHYNYAISDSSKSLKITWGIKEQMRGSIFEFFILVKNSSGMCQSLIHLTCGSCDEPEIEVILTKEQNDKRQDLIKCKPVRQKAFQPGNVTFNYVMKIKNPISDFTVEIYGTNLMGVHLLNWKSPFARKGPDLDKVKIAFIITVILFCMSFAILLFFYLKKKQTTTNTFECSRVGREDFNSNDYDNISEVL